MATAEVLKPRILHILPADRMSPSSHPLDHPRVRRAIIEGFKSFDTVTRTGQKLADEGRRGSKRVGRFIQDTSRDPEVQKGALAVIAIAAELLPNNLVGRIARELPAVIRGAQSVAGYWKKPVKSF